MLKFILNRHLTTKLSSINFKSVQTTVNACRTYQNGMSSCIFGGSTPVPKLCLNSKVIKQINREYAAVCALIQRSTFHTSSGANQKPPNVTPPPPPPSGDSNAPGGGKKPNKDDDQKMSSFLAKMFLWMLTAYMIVAVISLIFPGASNSESVRYVSWNEFVHQMLAKGEVEEVIIRPDMDIVTIILHEGAVIKGKRVDTKTYHMNVVDVDRVEERIREAERKLGIKDGVTITYARGGDNLTKLLISLAVAALIISFLARGRNFRAPISMDTFSNFTRAKFTLVDPLAGQGRGVKFNDVAGLKEAKIEVMEFVDYLKRPEHYRSLGAKVPRGALLLGPPGCGKTLLAKAVATESNVPFLSMNGSEFIEMIGGLGAARVRDLFKEGKKRSPCIIYIDEIDAIGRKRSGGSGGGGGGVDGSSGESEQTLNQLLVEMDGMISKDGVILLASTNRADVLDKALLRPGRFDRHILIDLPTLEERKQIFETHLSGIQLEMKPQAYSSRMASLTAGFSGADIANVCNEAALHAARFKQKQVTGVDLEYAVERVVGGTEKRSHAMSPHERRVVAYHESGHALVGWMLQHTDALLKVTIVPRTSLALGFAQYTPTDQKLYTTEQLFDRMCMALGGRVAESLTFNRITTGAQNDLEKVTKMAYAQIQQFGMNKNIGLVSFDDVSKEDRNKGRRPYSKRLQFMMDQEAKKLITDAYLATEKVLIDHKEKLEELAEALLKKETLNYVDVEQLLGPPPFGQKKLVEFAEFDTLVVPDGVDDSGKLNDKKT